MQSDATVVFIAAVFFKEATVIITTLSQKTLHWQLNKVMPSGMCNCNLKAID